MNVKDIEINKYYIFIEDRPVRTCPDDEYKLELERDSKDLNIPANTNFQVIGIQTREPGSNNPYPGSNPWVYGIYEKQYFKTCFDNLKNVLKLYDINDDFEGLPRKPKSRFELLDL